MGCRLCSPTAPGRCLHFECRGLLPVSRAWRCEGRPPLPHHFVCVETFTLPYLTLSRDQAAGGGPISSHRPPFGSSRGCDCDGRPLQSLISFTSCLIFMSCREPFDFESSIEYENGSGRGGGVSW